MSKGNVDFKSFGEADIDKLIEKVGKEYEIVYKRSFLFRCWIKWDNLVFTIKHFFKETLTNFTGYIIFWIFNPKLRKIATWRKND